MTFTIDKSILEQGAHEIIRDKLNHLDQFLEEFSKNAVNRINKSDPKNSKHQILKEMFEIINKNYDSVMSIVSEYIDTKEYYLIKIELESRHMRKINEAK
jgi:hypothetical protein